MLNSLEALGAWRSTRLECVARKVQTFPNYYFLSLQKKFLWGGGGRFGVDKRRRSFVGRLFLSPKVVAVEGWVVWLSRNKGGL